MTERKLKDVDFRNPDAPDQTQDVFDRMFQRGPDVAADGGEAGAAERRDEDEDEVPVEEQTLKDVDKTPPGEDEGANPVWERGGEPVVDDEEDEDE